MAILSCPIMVFLNYKALPWFWYGFNHFLFGDGHDGAWPRPCSRPCSGGFAFRSRVTGVYLSIITQALTYALMLAFSATTWASAAITDFTKDLAGYDLHSDRTRVVLLLITVAGARGQLHGLPYDCPNSRAGRVMRAIRDAESRTRFIGIRSNPSSLDLRILAIIRGASPVPVFPQIGIINPANSPHQFDRSCHLGCRRRPGYALRRDRGCCAGELRENLSYGCVSRVWLFRTRCDVRVGDGVSATRDYWLGNCAS